jgi:hypothetical protein
VEQSQGGRTWRIALQGEPLPLRVTTSRGRGDPGAIDFLEYNEPFRVTAPAPGTVVDLNQLTKAGT